MSLYKYLFATGALALNGCAFFTPPMEHPVIEEKLNPAWLSPATVGTLSVVPDRRVVLVNFHTNRFCAEAPTEVGTDLSRVLQATASANLPQKVKADIGVATALASTNSVLNRRTQGMQLFLANSYFVCQMYMNEAINAEQLMKYQLEVFSTAANLINNELPYMYKQEATMDKEKLKLPDNVEVLKKLMEIKTPTPSPVK